ncbi:MAG: hypothetical protein OEX19_16255 [Gammaproteobacteria bacterium]|nr:hypothetical protein [Gammaproteobacteria bacterium]
MKLFKLLGVSFFLISISTQVVAEKVVVIVNDKNMQELNKQDVAAIYSDNIIEWDNGNKIMSYDLPEGDKLRDVFSENILGMSTSEAVREWLNRKITNSARNPPRSRKERLLLLTVKRNGNAIGYVSETAARRTEGVRVVMTIDE